jgi:hypothetical protein
MFVVFSQKFSRFLGEERGVHGVRTTAFEQFGGFSSKTAGG